MALDDEERAVVVATSLLFHAGCTAGSSHFAAFIAADELTAQRELCLCDPDNMTEVFAWLSRNVAKTSSLPVRVGRVLQVVAQGDAVMGEFERGCSEIGSRAAGRLGMSAQVQHSLRHVCETWRG